MATPLAPETIITQFETLAGDSLDSTTELFLMNQVKDTLETQTTWRNLLMIDQSQTLLPSDTFQNTKPLPANFGNPHPKGIYVGGDLIPYLEVPLESQIRWQSVTHRYFIDYFNSKYAVCGANNPGGVITMPYYGTSPTLALGPNAQTLGTPWVFPARFHPILPYLMAKKFFAIDQGDKSRAWDDRWDAFMKEMLDAMVYWNAKNIMEASANDGMAIDLSAIPNVIAMDQGGPSGNIFG